jgi:hypothetical protein
MIFDANQCGSSSASADRCGDATCSKSIDPVPATNSGATSAGNIIPVYVKSDQVALLGFVRRHMSFLRATSLNRMIKAIEKPQNKLFDRLYPEILNIADGSYICLSNDLFAKGKSQEQIEIAINRQMAPSQLQEGFPFFTNSLQLCEKRGGEYIGAPPLERIVNRGQVVLTFEYDPDRDEREFLEEQIRWSIAGSNKWCRLDVLYDALCRFRDLRHIEVVWSGNKSFHIHVLADSRHLARSRFAGDIEVPPGAYPEVPDGLLLRSGLMACWSPIEEIIRQRLEIAIAPDPRLKEPDRYRRTPWGVRIATDHRDDPTKNILEAPARTRIPQIVIYSRGRAYSRSGDEWLLPPRSFFEEVRRPRSSRSRRPSTTMGALDPATREDLIAALKRLCESLFGAPENAPFAVDVDRYKDEWRIKFRNDLRDRTPGSFLIGRYNTIAVGSRDPDIQRRRFEFPVSANELVEAFLSQGTLSVGLPDRPLSWLERFFADTMAWLHHSDSDESIDAQPVVSPYGFQIERLQIGDQVIPKKTFRSVLTYATDHQLSAIVSAEGASKTSTVLDVMLDDCDDYRLIHPGFLVVACRSYEQAHRKCAEFNQRKGPEKGFRGAVLRSFDEVFREVVPGFRSSAERAARDGWSSEIEAVYADPRHAQLDVLNDYRHQIQYELGWRGNGGRSFDQTIRDSTVIFTTHGLAQNWFHPGGTRYWLHPRFEEWLQARNDLDYTTERLIRGQIRYETQFSWVLHDECSMADLLTIHPRETVDWAHKLIASEPDFKTLGMMARLEAFEAYRTDGGAVSFDEMLGIVDAHYTAQDLITINPEVEPFGVNNSPNSPYLRIGGQQYYAGIRDWWTRNSYRLTVTTTERKIRMALEFIRRKQLERIDAHPKYGPALREWRGQIDTVGIIAKPQVPPTWRITDLPVASYLPRDRMRVQIYLDDRARAYRKDKPGREWVRHIHEEIRASDPDAIIISNKADEYGITPNKAKGLNAYIGRRIYYVMMFPSPDQYRDLLVENAVFGASNCVKLHLLDEFDQIVGRTLGFRYRPGSEVTVIMPTRLWRQVGLTLLTQSNYDPRVMTDFPW